jgi:hypothetical protein
MTLVYLSQLQIIGERGMGVLVNLAPPPKTKKSIGRVVVITIFFPSKFVFFCFGKRKEYP